MEREKEFDIDKAEMEDEEVRNIEENLGLKRGDSMAAENTQEYVKDFFFKRIGIRLDYEGN